MHPGTKILLTSLTYKSNKTKCRGHVKNGTKIVEEAKAEYLLSFDHNRMF